MSYSYRAKNQFAEKQITPMKQLTVFYGAATSYYHFLPEMQKAVQSGKIDFLAIVPVNRAVRKLKRTLVEHSLRQALPDPPVFTFDGLLLELYRALPQARQILSREMLLVLVKEVMNTGDEAFGYFGTEQEPNEGLVHKVAEMLSELRSFGYDSRAFARVEVEERSAYPQKYRAFARLLQLMEERFGPTLIDEPFARAQAAQQLTEELFRKKFPGIRRIFVSGYGLFSPPMFEFIERVSQWVEVTVKLDYLPENERLFGHTQRAFRRFQDMGAHLKRLPSASRLAQHLFLRRGDHSAPVALQTRIYLAGLTDREQEVAFIAGQIREFFRQGIPLHRIAVTFSHLEKYVPIIRKVFEEYGIPFNLSTGFELAKAPLVSVFLGLLQLIEQGFPTEKTLALLSSPFVKIPEGLNLSLARRVCTMARTTALRRHALQRLKQFVRNQPRNDEDELSSIDPEQAEATITHLQEALQPLYDFPRQGTAFELRKSFLQLLNRYELVHWYRRDFSYLSEREKELSFRAYNRFVKVFERTIWTLQLLYGSRKIERRMLADAFRSALGKELYNPSEWPDYGVQIMPRLEILAVDFDVLFVGGLVDGDFPRASVKDIFFGDSVRSAMGLPASEELLDQDRFLFYQLLDSGAKDVFLTHPNFLGEEGQVPSAFLADVQETFATIRLEPDDELPLFTNRQTLWKNLGLDIGFLANQERLEKARHRLDVLLALEPQSREEISDLLYRIRFASLRRMGLQMTRYEGNLAQNERLVQNLQQRYQHRVWSVTQLETYGFCPMKYFLRYVLHVEEPPKVEEEITPLERGLLLHRILFRFFSTLREKGMVARPWEHKALLQAIAREEFDAMPYEGLFWELEKLRFLGNEQVRGILDVFLEQEEGRLNNWGVTPAFFELAFGRGRPEEKDPQSTDKPVTVRGKSASFRLQGSIDRVDRDVHGHVAIIDYKTGKARVSAEDVLNGIHFQIPLYLKVLPQLVEQSVPVYGGLYQLHSARSCKLLPVLVDATLEVIPLQKRSRAFLPNDKITDEQGQPLMFDELLDFAVETALQKIELLGKGWFAHTAFPGHPGCGPSCPYHRICQKVQGKLERMAREKTAKDQNEA